MPLGFYCSIGQRESCGLQGKQLAGVDVYHPIF